MVDFFTTGTDRVNIQKGMRETGYIEAVVNMQVNQETFPLHYQGYTHELFGRIDRSVEIEMESERWMDIAEFGEYSTIKIRRNNEEFPYVILDNALLVSSDIRMNNYNDGRYIYKLNWKLPPIHPTNNQRPIQPMNTERVTYLSPDYFDAHRPKRIHNWAREGF